jgi:hypothetical protein
MCRPPECAVQLSGIDLNAIEALLVLNPVLAVPEDQATMAVLPQQLGTTLGSVMAQVHRAA